MAKKAVSIFSIPKKNPRKIIRIPLWILPEVALLIVCLIIAFANYTPNTWLAGWDNLFPEFDFKQNFIRNLFGVWSEYRGPGELSGQAFMADLPRSIILQALQLIGVATANLRYAWTFGMLFIGAAGTTRLFRYLLKSKYDLITTQLAAFLSGMFYIFNLSTLQLFFVPFDSFATFFGFLPWFVLSYIKVLFTKRKPGSIFFLLITSLLISPSFFIYTLTFTLSIYLLPFILEQLLSKGPVLKKIKNILFPSVSVLLIQFFWLLPIGFFILSGNANTVNQARINAISSPETLQRNLQFTGLNSIIQLKGYLFENLDLIGDKYAPLLAVWKDHLANPAVILIQVLIILITIIGFVFSLRKKILHHHSLALATGLTAFLMLGAGLPVINHLPLLGEALRSPFTKFSYTLALSYSIYFGLGSLLIMDLFSFLHHRFTYFLTTFSLGVAFIIFMTPAFTGNLTSPTMRLKIPQEYFDTFEFFKNQDPATRIANFPQYTFWGWNYYNWGYRGSGFLWYGIKQPILDRAFDVWEKTSEKYYEEISAAIYSDNQQDFENLVDKYAINWILIDKNAIAPSPNIDLGNDKLQKFLENSSKFGLVASFNDRIFIYKTDLDKSIKNFLSASLQSSDFSLQPFANLPLRPLASIASPNSIQITSNNSEANNAPSGQITLNIPSYSDTEHLIPVSISYRKTEAGLDLRLLPLLPNLKLNNQDIYPADITPNYIYFDLPESSNNLVLNLNDQYYELQLPEEVTASRNYAPLVTTYLPSKELITVSLYSGSATHKIDLTTPLSLATPYQCYTNKPNRKIEKLVDQNTISLYGTDLVGCLSTKIPPANINQIISLEFSYSSNTGTPANANITNQSLGGENSPQPLPAKKTPTFTKIFAKPQLAPMQVNLILEANQTKSSQEVVYKNIQVNHLPILGESRLTMNSIPSQQITINNSEASLVPSGQITATIPLPDSPYTIRSDAQNSLLAATPTNCDNFNQGKFDRQSTINGFIYTATNANSCDQMNLKLLPHSTNYLIGINSQNVSGLSPVICLENHATKRCDVFERLINGNQTMIQPIANSKEAPGYTLHLSNQSFGDQPVKNVISSISVSPFPLQFLKNIGISSDGGPQGLLRGETVKSTHPVEFLYTAEVDSSEVISLFQTRSPYWKAIEVSKNDLSLPLWKLIVKLPLLYLNTPSLSPPSQGEKGDSLPCEGEGLGGVWFNQWVVPPGTHHLAIFYLPQYLEFLGFIVLPLPFIFTFVWEIKNLTHRKKYSR